MIKVFKVSNVMMGVEVSDNGILLELQDYFAFPVPGFKWMPAYKDGAWDGKIKLFNAWNKQLYIGLLPQLQKFAKMFSHDIEVAPSLHSKEQLSANDLLTWINDHKVFKETKGEIAEIKPRYYQKIGLYQMINQKRCTLVAPTAAGKSLMIYLFALWFSENHPGQKIALVVPTTGLVEQMVSDFSEYSKGAFDHNVHKIYAGKEKNNDKLIYITTWQSVYDLPKKYFDQFDSIIIDECHGAKADSLKRILETCDAEYRCGLTGTMHDTEAHEWVIEGLIGPTMDLISMKELMQRKWVSNLQINCVTFDYPDHIKKEIRGLSYPEEMDFLIDCQERTDAIVLAAGKVKQNSFVLFNRIRYGEKLKEEFEKKYPNRKVYIVNGATATEDRESLRKALEYEDGSIVVASYKVFSTGVSINNLHHIFFAEPVGKSKFKIFQSIGRTLRLHKAKAFATLWDFSDKLTNDKSRLNHTMKHFVERIKNYNQQEFKYRMLKHSLEVEDMPSGVD